MLFLTFLDPDLGEGQDLPHLLQDLQARAQGKIKLL